MVPHGWTGEVEKLPKEVTIAADKNDGIRAPNGNGGVIGVQMKQTVLTVVLVMASKATRHAHVTKYRRDRTKL